MKCKICGRTRALVDNLCDDCYLAKYGDLNIGKRHNSILENNIGTYEKLGTEIGKLVDKKNMAYGDSFNKSGEILKILYPDGVNPDDYTDMLGIIRVIDKLFRIATEKDAFDESPWKDIAGYALLGLKNNEMS